ncbi:MAG TPA: hypothetical protein VH143_21925 [Kofleriaceae bacterium]|nr:hypothetical protein [Kofleriaceae bacterium]
MNRDVYFALIIIGLVPVIGAALAGGPFGSGATLCLLVVGIGLVGLVTDRPRVPRARVRR